MYFDILSDADENRLIEHGEFVSTVVVVSMVCLFKLFCIFVFFILLINIAFFIFGLFFNLKKIDSTLIATSHGADWA